MPGYRIECGCLLIRIRFRSAGAVYHLPVYDTEVSPYAPVFVEDCIVGSYTAECQSFEQCGWYPLSPQIFICQISSAFSLSTIFFGLVAKSVGFLFRSVFIFCFGSFLLFVESFFSTWVPPVVLLFFLPLVPTLSGVVLVIAHLSIGQPTQLDSDTLLIGVGNAIQPNIKVLTLNLNLTIVELD